MRRRDFVTRVPAVAAGLTVGGAVGLAEASSEARGPEDALEARTAQGGSVAPSGFRLVGNGGEMVDAALVVAPHERFALITYVVECPYPVGSRAWLAIADRDENGQVVSPGTEGSELHAETGAIGASTVRLKGAKARRVVFPRFAAEDVEGGFDVRERARAVHGAVTEHGFDTVPGDGREWIVVHVEYRCPDGVEHVMCGMPLTWDPRLALGVMVRGQIE
jgi:hypothetical protein